MSKGAAQSSHHINRAGAYYSIAPALIIIINIIIIIIVYCVGINMIITHRYLNYYKTDQ